MTSPVVDLFEAMTTDERRLLYGIAFAACLLGMVVGLWLAAEWGQLKRLMARLVVLGVIGVGVWWFFVRQAERSRTQTATLPVTTVVLPPPAAAVSTTAPAASGSGNWWE